MFKRFVFLVTCILGMWALGAMAAMQVAPKQVLLTEADNGGSKTVYMGQVLTVELTANPSTGYRWEIRNLPKCILRLESSEFVHREFQEDAGSIIPFGAPETQMLKFKAIGKGKGTLTLVYQRPWERLPIDEYTIEIVVVDSVGIQFESPPQKPQEDNNTPMVRAAIMELTKEGPKISVGPEKKIPPLWETEQRMQSLGSLTPIMTEGFEGNFPEDNDWELLGDPTWDETDYRAHTGSKSGYCVAGGTSGVEPPGPYPNDVRAWMIYGPFDLSDARDAILSFYHWTETEYECDELFVGVSIDGYMFHGQAYSGNWASRAGGDGWYPEVIDLNELAHFNLSGFKQVWIAFVFSSDESIQYEGVYLDDISLVKETWTPPNFPSRFDWRERHGVTPVRDQGDCGSCWAFSTVGTTEASIQIKDAAGEDLSEQFLVSCNTGGGLGYEPWGCDGGWFAFDYFWNRPTPGQTGQNTIGAVPEEEKPYTATDEPCCTCTTPCPFDHLWRLSGWGCVDEKAEGPTCISYKGSWWERMPSIWEIKEAIMRYGPISAGVCVDYAFANYTGGVFEIDEGIRTNHAIMLVGWDDSLGRNGAWILKNSWGTGWGESGYMYIGYGISGVGLGASYVLYGPKYIHAHSADFDGDGKTDIAVWRMFNGAWYIKDQFSTYYGTAGDIPVPGDYNGDGKTDIAVFRPSSGAWYIKDQFSTYYGTAGDIPVPGDYNGDGKTDIAVFRPSSGKWYIKDQFSTIFGTAGDIPVPGDYDGDGETDIAVFRPSSGKWYIKDQFSTIFGTAGDIPVAK